MNILVADDDSLLATALERALRSAGCSVQTVGDGTTALTRLRESRFDVLITDWAMPGLDGVALTREAKQLPNCPRVLFYSAFHQPEAKVHAMNAGADVYLEKPTPLRVVLESVQNAKALMSQASKAAALIPQSSSFEALERLVSSGLWRGFNGFAATHIGNATRRSMSPITRARGAPTYTQSLRMVDARAGIEIQATLGSTKDGSAALIRSLLQLDAIDAAVISDFLFELANTILGYMAMAFGGLGFSFALGVPTDKTTAGAWDSETSTVLTDGRVELFVNASARVRGSESVRASALKENMVVVQDVRSPGGALLVPGGTRLSATAAERIARHLPSATFRVVNLAS